MTSKNELFCGLTDRCTDEFWLYSPKWSSGEAGLGRCVVRRGAWCDDNATCLCGEMGERGRKRGRERGERRKGEKGERDEEERAKRAESREKR